MWAWGLISDTNPPPHPHLPPHRLPPAPKCSVEIQYKIDKSHAHLPIGILSESQYLQNIYNTTVLELMHILATIQFRLVGHFDLK